MEKVTLQNGVVIKNFNYPDTIYFDDGSYLPGVKITKKDKSPELELKQVPNKKGWIDLYPKNNRISDEVGARIIAESRDCDILLVDRPTLEKIKNTIGQVGKCRSIYFEPGSGEVSATKFITL